MDILAHALYGATVCSDTGLAGGRTGSAASRWYRDATLWWALGFGILPDVVSMWLPFALHALNGPDGIFFHHYGGGWLTVYRLAHNLVIPFAVSGILFFARRKLFVPSLAWTVHVITDAISHGEGKFQTLLFYPFSSWGIDGISWWRAPRFFIAYWAVLFSVWVAIFAWRRTKRSRQTSQYL